MRIVTLLVAAAAFCVPVAAARADCAYEIGNLTPKVARVTDKAKRALVNKYLNKAITERSTNETGCLDDVTRARRALAEPPLPAKPAEERARVRTD